MQKAERGFFTLGQTIPVAPHRLEQGIRPNNVGFNEVARTVNGSMYMALSCKVDDSAWPVFGQQARYQFAITNVTLNKDVTRIALQARQGFQVAGIGQLVQVDNGLARARQPIQNKVTANKAGSAGHQNGHEKSNPIQIKRCRLMAQANTSAS